MSAATATRRCLRCRQAFTPPNRFRSVCDLCHALEEWRAAEIPAPPPPIAVSAAPRGETLAEQTSRHMVALEFSISSIRFAQTLTAARLTEEIDRAYALVMTQREERRRLALDAVMNAERALSKVAP